jgi:hypothetical protein
VSSVYKGTCYPSLDEAKLVHCSDMASSTVLPSGTLTSTFCPSPTASTLTIEVRENGSVVRTVSQPWPDYPTCGYDGATFTTDFFLAAILLLVTIFGIKKLMDLFNNHTERD